MRENKDDIARQLEDCLREEQGRFYRVAYGCVRDRDMALDAVQDAVLAAIRGCGSLRHPEYMRTWFYRILMNCCYAQLKRARREDIVAASPSPFPGEATVEDVVDSVAVGQALDRLDPESRVIVVMRFYEDMKLEDIAHVTGRNLSTVKSRLYRALEQLRSQLE